MTFTDLATQVRTCYNSLQQLVNTLSDGFAAIEGGGGGGSSYSTEEHVVGTWIDGKPLYQRSFEVSDVLDMQTVNTWVQTPVNIANVKSIINTTLNGNGAYIVVSSAMTNTGYVQVNSPRPLSLTNGYVLTTLYTKTTD